MTPVLTAAQQATATAQGATPPSHGKLTPAVCWAAANAHADATRAWSQAVGAASTLEEQLLGEFMVQAHEAAANLWYEEARFITSEKPT